MSNKHYTKRLRRVSKQRGLHSIRQLYDVARASAVREIEQRKREERAAYDQRAEQQRGEQGRPGADPGASLLAKMEAQDRARSAKIRKLAERQRRQP